MLSLGTLLLACTVIVIIDTIARILCFFRRVRAPYVFKHAAQFTALPWLTGLTSEIHLVYRSTLHR